LEYCSQHVMAREVGLLLTLTQGFLRLILSLVSLSAGWCLQCELIFVLSHTVYHVYKVGAVRGVGLGPQGGVLLLPVYLTTADFGGLGLGDLH